MSRSVSALLVALIFSTMAISQDTDQRWSYPYGDGRVSLVHDDGIIAVKMIAGLEDERGSLLAELRTIRGVGKVEDRDLQEYPGLWYVPVDGSADSRMRERILDRLSAAGVVEFAGPVFHYREAVMIPRPEVIVTFDGSVDDEEIRAVIRQSGLRFIKEFPAIDPTYLLGYEGPTSRAFEISDALTELEEVAVAEPNFIHDLPEMATPNDPLFPDQWDMLNTGQTGGTIGADMKAAAAWDISTGSSSIVVAVIDEGVDVDHPDLLANMVAGHDSVTADPTPGGIPGNANSTDGHGTCCAGIIAAVGNNGIGVAGVTWNSKIMPVRIGFGNFWTQTDWIIDGLTWPVDNGADVLSNSWGGGSASTSIQNAIIYGNTTGRGGLGCAVFFASGNDNSAVSYPALYPESIAVGASSPCDERKSPSSCDGETWWGSNYGSSLDFVAPGPLTTTVDIAGSGGYSSTDYTSSFNGTSSATPHAAGAGALLLAVAPDLTHDEVRTLMRQTADDQVGPPSEDTAGFDIYMGYGRINCETMLLAVASLISGPTNLTCSASGADVALSWTNGDSYSQVEVSRNGSVIATLAGSSTSYTDTSAGVGNISYGVRGFQGSDPSSSASCSVFMTGGATDLVWAPAAAAGTVAGGSAISAALTANGRSPLVVTTLDAVPSLDTFETVWVNLGIYPSNHVLTSTESSSLDDFLTNGVGGNFLYMEGGDTWAYDTATTVHSRFGISGLSDGTGDLSTVNGAAGTGCDLAGSSWSYSGENSWIDHLGTSGASVVTLTNSSPAYNVGVFNDGGSYRTFGASFEIGGLLDGSSTRASMVASILNCFSGSTPPPPAAPVADFSATPTSGEAPVAVSFTDASSGDVSSYSWNFGDGGGSTAQNPSHTYTAAGTYSVTLTVTGPGGSDTATCGSCITVTDPPPPPPVAPVAGFTPGSSGGEAPVTVSFVDSSTGDITSYSWTFGDGGGSTAQNPSHTYTAAGTYSVTLTVTGPGGSDTATCGSCITVTDPPPPPPVAGFTPGSSGGEAPVTVSFVNSSTGDITSYSWNFGDGGGSTAQNPSHTYTAAGTYNVTLTVTGPGGSDTATCGACITVTDPPPPPPVAPVAGFTPDGSGGEAPIAVSFVDSSTGDITSYSWDFGDGGGSTAQNPSHTYNFAGTYSVSLTVTGPGGSDTATCGACIVVTGGATDLVWAPAAAVGSVAGGSAISAALTANGRSPLVVTTLDEVASLDTFETVWVNLGIYPSNHVLTSAESSSLDDFLTNGVGGNFLYMEGGDTWAYDAATTVHSRFGISGLSDGTGDLSTVNGAAGTGCNLAGSSWSYSGENNWIDHLGTSGASVVTLTNSSPAYNVGVFNDGGSYRTFGTSFEIGGLVDGASTRASMVASILDCFSGTTPPPPAAPVAGFTPGSSGGEAPVSVSFMDSSTGDITSYSWDFGDGGGSTAQNPSHTYNFAGTYSVTLTVTGPGGSDSSTCGSCITVTDPPPPPPMADFSPDSPGGEAPVTVSFMNMSFGDITSYSWDFGDGGGSTAQNPSHTYTAAGTYSVTLTVTGPGGSDTATCGSCIVVTDPVPPPPVADFSPDSSGGEAPVTVSFMNMSFGDITSYSWDFGDGGGSTAQNPSHTYTVAGTYSVSLTVTGPGGSDTVTCGACIVVMDPPPPPPPPSTTLYYISFLSTTSVPGLGSVRDEDIVTYDPATNSWAWYLDGSDVGIGSTDINALSVLADGSVLVSFNSGSFSLSGLTGGPSGTTVEDSDLVLFTPSATGSSSAGTWSFYLDGSDCALTTNGEDIDGVCYLDDGTLLMSTLGTARGGGPTNRDEDVMLFTPTSIGSASGGSWTTFFDGSDVGFSNSGGEDLNAISLDYDGTLLFSTQGTYSGSGSSGADEDVSRFTGSFGSTTSGFAELVFDMSALGIDVSEDIDGLSIR